MRNYKKIKETGNSQMQQTKLKLKLKKNCLWPSKKFVLVPEQRLQLWPWLNDYVK